MIQHILPLHLPHGSTEVVVVVLGLHQGQHALQVLCTAQQAVVVPAR